MAMVTPCRAVTAVTRRMALGHRPDGNTRQMGEHTDARTSNHTPTPGRPLWAAALVAFSLVAAACGDKKDDDAVDTEDTEAEAEETDTTDDDRATEDTAEVTTPETRRRRRRHPW